MKCIVCNKQLSDGFVCREHLHIDNSYEATQKRYGALQNEIKQKVRKVKSQKK